VRIKTMESRPHGNKRKVEGLFEDSCGMLTLFLSRER